MLKTYYNLTKPGIIYGNLVNLLSGFLLACALTKSFSLSSMIAVMAGTALVIASGCVINNYIDRGIDKHMKRTKKRALVLGEISGRQALAYAAVLGALGFTVLVLWTNAPTAVVGIIGFIDYVVAYGFWKRRSPAGTLVGSISGATPPLAGYLALTGQFDAAALIVFLIFAAWQMPHFYAISLYRSEEYKAAGIPVLPLKKGRQYTKAAIIAYTIVFTVCCIALSIWGYTGVTFAIAMGLLGALWLYKEFAGFNAADDNAWARKIFGFSLLVTLVLVVMLPLGAILP